MRTSNRYTITDIIVAVRQSKSTANVCRLLGIVPRGGNYKTINIKINQLRLDTSHFTRQGWSIGMKFPGRGVSLKEILVKNSTYTNTSRLKKRLLDAGLLKNYCYRCGRKKWYKKPIPLELHHKNGVNMDHRQRNIELLCPNCHAFTNNYRGRKCVETI